MAGSGTIADASLPCFQGPRRARKPVRVQRTNSDDHEVPAVSPDDASTEKDGPLTEPSPAANAPIAAVEPAAAAGPTTSPPKPKLRGACNSVQW